MSRIAFSEVDGPNREDLEEITDWSAHVGRDEVFDPSWLLGGGSLSAVWASVLSDNGDLPLFKDESGVWITRTGFLTATSAIAARMAGLGVGPGERVILSAASSIGLVAHYVACLRLGAVVVPVNTAYSQHEMAHIVSEVKPSAAIVDSPERLAWISAAFDAGDMEEPFCGPGASLPPCSDELRSFDPSDLSGPTPPRNLCLDQADHQDIALIAFTSGTTGRPKGALITHGNLLACARSLNLAWRWSWEDRLVLCLPLFHMHGLAVGVNGTLCAGGSAVLCPKFDQAVAERLMIDNDATMFLGVPTMYQKFLESQVFSGLSGLRLVVSGSAPLPAETFAEIRNAVGRPILERYGTTESLINISNPFEGDRIPGTVGTSLPGVRVALARSDGQLYIGGPTVFAGYLSNQAATDSVLGRDGWFATGDVGVVDERGVVSIAGRLKDLIITGGYNVYPAEVEEALRSHPSVGDAAVIGCPSRMWGEEVVAFVIPRDGAEEEEILSHAKTRLANYKIPKRIIFIGEFPRNALGKVLAYQLRAMVASDRS